MSVQPLEGMEAYNAAVEDVYAARRRVKLALKHKFVSQKKADEFFRTELRNRLQDRISSGEFPPEQPAPRKAS